MPRHFLDLFDITAEEAAKLLGLASSLKAAPRRPESGAFPLAGRMLGLVFDKPSLRTRVSFEAAMAQLGGSAIFMSGKDAGMGGREPVRDFARVVSEYLDALAVRTFAQSLLEELAEHASIPIINALSDDAHPCQAMGDMLTLREHFGRLEGLRLTFVGDGNNVARSLAVASAMLGVEFTLAAPRQYDYPADFRERFDARFPGVGLRVSHDAAEGVAGADAVYTDVWTSMGQEAESEDRLRAFRGFRVDGALFGEAEPHAVFLHCLPARREEEVAPEVIDGDRSLIVSQAGNRLHFQKALLVWLIGEHGTH